MGQASAVEAPFEDLRVGHRAVGTVGIVHSVQPKRYGVQVALRVDAGSVDEELVVMAMHNRRVLEVGREAQRLQVDVDDGVRLRQQPRNLRRRRFAQPHCYGQRRYQRQHQEQRVPRAFTHQCCFYAVAARAAMGGSPSRPYSDMAKV